ncbi:hypothetical protein E2C01_023904 [Portunus trituberculatus]|uniref:Uncharacterized protein n=1 Tax=Portunus trituberculatus TaxID=210409 RepID=A0A5B7EBS7_PORTR|nr:hypothetical protein [Portunus trituberculatus]
MGELVHRHNQPADRVFRRKMAASGFGKILNEQTKAGLQADCTFGKRANLWNHWRGERKRDDDEELEKKERMEMEEEEEEMEEEEENRYNI